MTHTVAVEPLQAAPARRTPQRGVTLMELLIAMVVVGILAAIAIPSYRSYVIRAQRTEAKSALLATAGALERCFTRFNAYDDADCAVAAELPRTLAEGNYQIQAQTLTAGDFVLHAVPQAGQTEDVECRTLTLDSRDNRGVAGGATRDAQHCWNR